MYMARCCCGRLKTTNRQLIVSFVQHDGAAPHLSTPRFNGDRRPSTIFTLFGNNSSSSLVYSSIGPLSVTERAAAASKSHRLPVLRRASAGQRNRTMTRIFVVSAVAAVIASALVTDAQALNRQTQRHPNAGRNIEQTRRSYLDPGTSAIVGTENRYYSDTARYSYRQLGPAFTNEHFDLPPDPDPLFRF
jgi:hypothetical protein